VGLRKCEPTCQYLGPNILADLAAAEPVSP
jgi:hypothetical protein